LLETFLLSGCIIRICLIPEARKSTRRLNPNEKKET